MKEIVKLLGIHQTNTTVYHPQTDGLVEWFNHTLTTILAKTAKKGSHNWDEHLPYVLFAYCPSEQQLPGESLFFLLYGRDPRLSSEPAVSPSKTKQQVDLHEYGVYVADKLSEAQDLAKRNIKKVQKQQKKTYNQYALILQLESFSI